MKTFNYKSFVLAMLVCMAGALCVSCGGDDGDDDGASGNDGGQSSYSKMIVGEWTVYYEDDGPRRVDISFTAAGIYSAEESYKQGGRHMVFFSVQLQRNIQRLWQHC